MAAQEHASDQQGAVAPRVDVKEAVRRALAFLRDLYPDGALPNLRLEEVELSEDGRHWLVTYGFTAAEQDVGTNALWSAIGGSTTRQRRDYTLIQVDAETGAPFR
ncbi:MAG TPA: hypothetical protein VFW96_27425 [Thermomicrobiales bacterium]|nr:hypothetical protein [Thermomicrobiales bacterium]